MITCVILFKAGVVQAVKDDQGLEIEVRKDEGGHTAEIENTGKRIDMRAVQGSKFNNNN